MDDTTIEISGLDDVNRLLGEVPARLARQVFRRALGAAAVPVTAALKPRIPKLTGDLAAHLETNIYVHDDGLTGVASINFGEQGWKARLLETGHRMIGHAPNKTDKGEMVKPEPFMGPATSASADAAIEAFADSVREQLDRNELRLAS